MKHVIVLLACVLIGQLAPAAPLKAKRVEPELGASLGFQIYRFEAKLSRDDVLLVRHITETNGTVTETEYGAVGDGAEARYEIVLVDSGAFQPNLRNTYMLRYSSANGFIENERLSQWSDDGAGKIEFVFSRVDRDERSRKLTWIGSVEKYAEVVKRWPDLPKPRNNGSSGSTRLIRTE